LLCWIDTSQEALDTTLIAYRVAEDRRVFLPLAISADGAFLTHSQALTMVPPKSKVDQFLPRYNRGDLLLHPDNPITVAPQANEDWVIEIRRQNNEAMARAVGVIEEAYADFRRVFGRGPENPWFEEYMTDDAEVILVGMGTISLPIKVAIREMRAKGRKVGLVRLRWFRPFPTEKLVGALSKASALGIIDRDYSFGSPFGSGVVANEIRAALYNAERRPPLLSFICGLGVRAAHDRARLDRLHVRREHDVLHDALGGAVDAHAAGILWIGGARYGGRAEGAHAEGQDEIGADQRHRLLRRRRRGRHGTRRNLGDSDAQRVQ